jgi:hypothetical protein
MLSVTDANYVDGYRIELTFSDGRKGCVDLGEYLRDTKILPFKQLLDLAVFKAFKVERTLVWTDGLDIAPEYLYYEAFKDDSNLLPLFQRWGYVAEQDTDHDDSVLKVAEEQAEYKTRNA